MQTSSGRLGTTGPQFPMLITQRKGPGPLTASWVPYGIHHLDGLFPPVGDLELVEDKPIIIVLGLSLYVTAMSWRSLPTPFLWRGCVVCEPTRLRQEECLLGRTECGAEWSGITPTQWWM